MTNKKILKKFGRYLILDHLVDGGMAKICRARFLGGQGDKIVAIKMVQPQYSKDEAFVNMFLEEIKVTFNLIHPNIAQTYDSGIIENQLFASMEYVDGKNLKQFLDRLNEREFVFPVEISSYIISQVCQALTYAHNFTHKLTGKHLKIIHRDISPHNIMITYDGVVKVIDFGIAKTNTDSDATQAGTIKGKLSYLAPEYLEGKQLDHRYDQFAVGITLWELLCSRKLFKATNELAVLKLIQSCKVPPPSSINPNVPEELDEIVLKALSKDRKGRYENMDQFNRALVKFLYSNFPEFNPTDLSYFSKELFKEEIKNDRHQLFEFGQIDVTKYSDEGESKKTKVSKRVPTNSNNDKKRVINVRANKNGANSKEEEDQNLAVGRAGPTELVFDDLDTQSTNLEVNKEMTKSHNKEFTRTNRTQVNSEDSSYRTRADLTQNRTTTRTVLDNDYTSSKIEVKKESASNPLMKVVMVAAICFVSLFVFKSKILPLIKQKETKPEAKIVENVEPLKGTLAVNNLNAFQKVFINGKRVKNINGPIEVDLNKEIKVRVKEEMHKTFYTKIILTSENPSESITIPKMPKVEEGELVTIGEYVNGTFLEIELDGEIIKKSLPLDRPIRMPAGNYDVKIVNPSFNLEKEIPITIEADKRSILNNN